MNKKRQFAFFFSLLLPVLTVRAAEPSRYNIGDVKLPLTCGDSLQMEDVLQSGAHNQRIDRLLTKNVICQAVRRKSQDYCGQLNKFAPGQIQDCRFAYAQTAVAMNEGRPADVFQICLSNFVSELSPAKRDSLCKELVKNMQGGSVQAFCSFAAPVFGKAGSSKFEANCKRDFAFIWGNRACPKEQPDGSGMIRCPELAATTRAARTSNAQDCGDYEVCLAALKPAEDSCARDDREIAAAFCQSSGIASDIKKIAIENAFRRRYGFAPYSSSQGFLTRSVLNPENQLRRSLGLPAFKMGDRLISSMPESDRKAYLRSLKRAKPRP